jgi:hypothetical protein
MITSTPIMAPAQQHLPKGTDSRYWQGAWFTTPGGRVITGYLDDHLATQLTIMRPTMKFYRLKFHLKRVKTWTSKRVRFNCNHSHAESPSLHW